MSDQPTTTPQTAAPRRTFASTMQLVLIFVMATSFVMITQQENREIYWWGVHILVASTLLQIAFGNIPSHFNFRKSLVGVAIAAVIIGGIVVLAINLAPTLLSLGR
ncbi:MAG: hypothetical protein GYB67_14285 [Chloroflexi bacterium]|nr:hypothetical protein [Chloroflexota bacterium]